MAKHSNNMAIPVEVQRLRLCSSLQGCGSNVTLCLKESDAPLISIYDDETLGFSDWEVGNNGCPKSFLAHNNAGKNIVLLPLDNKIITGPKIKQGGVADCAVLTLSDMSFIEFKTNVTSNSEENINSKIEDAIGQLWHTYDGILKHRCAKNNVIIPELVNVDFFIIFNKDLDVTGTMASRLNHQTEFMNNYGFPLYFDNEKEF